MKKQKNQKEVKKESKATQKKGADKIKTYYEAESWMFSACGD